MAADRQLFEDELRMLYDARQQAARQAEANVATSTLPLLKRMLRAESRKHDAGLVGIRDTNRQLLSRHGGGLERDLVNIEHAQVSAHLLIARYGTLRTYARALAQPRVASLLGHAVDAIRHDDEAFSALARHIVGRRPSGRYGREWAVQTTVAMHPAVTAAVVWEGSWARSLCSINPPRHGVRPSTARTDADVART